MFIRITLQEETIDADIDHDLGAVHTPQGLKDPHHIRRDPRYHARRIGDHYSGAKGLHLLPQMEGQARGPDRSPDPDPD